MNPYKIEPPFYVSFSGRRTSGFLLRKIIDSHGGKLPKNGFCLFANTGKEHQATYDFINKIEANWCEVVWLEYIDQKPNFSVVKSETSSRKGEPFAALIAKKQFLPRPLARFCTQDLKVAVMQKFMKSQNLTEWETAIGLRHDEPRRVASVRANPKASHVVMPMYEDRISKEMVLDWWKKNNFDLQLPNNDPAFGNCDLCFLKGRDRIARVLEHDPKLADWWIEQERLQSHPFNNSRPNYKTMLYQVTVQGKLFEDMNDHTIPCDCTE